MKNRISGLLMETGVSYNKLRLHRMGYFEQLLSTSEEITNSICPLLKLCREHIDRSIRLDRTLLRSLEQDPMLSERLERLRTVPGVGPHHRPDLGSRGGRYFPLPLHQAGHQLLRVVRCREEFSGQGAAHSHLQTAQQTYPVNAGRGGQTGSALQPGIGPAV
jgi:hypothetical protein